MSVTNSPPSRLPSGVSTSPRGYLFGEYPYPTPARVHQYFNDFDTYAAGDWTVTGVTGTTSLTGGNGGFILATTNNTANDIQANQLTKPTYAFASGAQLWFAINVNFTAITQQAFAAGLANTFANGPTGPTDGVYFRKGATSSTMNLCISGTSTTTTIPIGTVAAGQAYTLGFYYDGKPSPTLYGYSTIPYTTGTASAGVTGPTAFGQPYFTGGNQRIVSADANGGNSATGLYVLSNLPIGNLTLGWACQTNTTIAQVATIDYILGANEIITRY